MSTAGLACGKQYSVDLRASFNGGATWCYSGAAWGDACTLNTEACTGVGALAMAAEGAAEAALRMYPNPNRGDQLFLSLDAIGQGVETVSVDIFDAFGKRVTARTIAAQASSSRTGGNGFVNTILQLNGELANGLYLVSVTAGERQFTERLVVQP